MFNLVRAAASAVFLTTSSVLLLASMPTDARAAAASCNDFDSCFANPSSPCATSDLLTGVAMGAVDGLGDLLCFIGDPKCSCFTALTDEQNPESKFDAWFAKVSEIANTCGGTASGGRSLSGIAFGAANDVCTPTFAADVAPVLQTACGTCHISSTLGQFNFAAGRSALVNVPSKGSPLVYVAPGNVAGSYLFHKISGTQLSVGGIGDRMPQGGTLPQKDIDTIEAWIVGGARP